MLEIDSRDSNRMFVIGRDHNTLFIQYPDSLDDTLAIARSIGERRSPNLEEMRRASSFIRTQLPHVPSAQVPNIPDDKLEDFILTHIDWAEEVSSNFVNFV